MKSDDGQEFVIRTINILSELNKVRRKCRYNSEDAVFTEKVKGTNRECFRKNVFENGDAKFIGVLPIITKNYNNKVHTATHCQFISQSNCIILLVLGKIKKRLPRSFLRYIHR